MLIERAGAQQGPEPAAEQARHRILAGQLGQGAGIVARKLYGLVAIDLDDYVGDDPTAATADLLDVPGDWRDQHQILVVLVEEDGLAALDGLALLGGDAGNQPRELGGAVGHGVGPRELHRRAGGLPLDGDV